MVPCTHKCCMSYFLLKSFLILFLVSKGATSEGGAPKPKKDEWHDFEEEKEKDYSGLKIQDLQVILLFSS